jgi:hypothetical protein
LGKHSASIFTLNKNTEKSTEEQCLIQPLGEENADCITQHIFKNIVRDIPDEKVQSEEVAEFRSFVELEVEDFNECIDKTPDSVPPDFRDTVHIESLKYIAGYVAYRFRDKYSLGFPSRDNREIKGNMPDWIQYISRGFLLYPSKQLIAATEVLDSVFNDIHKNSLSKDKFIFDTVTDRTLEKLEDKLPREVIHCLARTRTYIRLREINTKISFDNCKKRLDRKMKKFTNLKK